MTRDVHTVRFYLDLGDAVTDEQAITVLRRAIAEGVPARKVIEAMCQWEDMRKARVQYLPVSS